MLTKAPMKTTGRNGHEEVIDADKRDFHELGRNEKADYSGQSNSRNYADQNEGRLFYL